MVRKAAEATKAWRMRCTRGEIGLRLRLAGTGCVPVFLADAAELVPDFAADVLLAGLCAGGFAGADASCGAAAGVDAGAADSAAAGLSGVWEASGA